MKPMMKPSRTTRLLRRKQEVGKNHGAYERRSNDHVPKQMEPHCGDNEGGDIGAQLGLPEKLNPPARHRQRRYCSAEAEWVNYPIGDLFRRCGPRALPRLALSRRAPRGALQAT